MTRSRFLVLASLAVAAGACNSGAPIDSSETTDTSSMSCEGGLIEAAHDVADRYPNWGAALHDHPRSGVTYHPSHSRKELSGFGVTLVTMGAPISPTSQDKPWTGDLNDPSLLFFEKTDAPEDEWPLIGFGYHHSWDDDEGMGGCVRPEPDCDNPDELARHFIVHEAGYHVHGFEVATQSNVRKNHGTLDAAMCNRIDKNDIKDTLWATGSVGAKHGRAWTMHVWLHPDTGLPMIATEDPWERDGGDGWEHDTPAGAFVEQGDCDCADADLVPPSLETAPGPGTSREVDASDLASFAVYDADTADVGLRVMPLDGGGTEITMLGWYSRLDDLGLRTSDVVERVITLGTVTGIVDIDGSAGLFDALDAVSSLRAGDVFWIQIERDGDRVYLAFVVV